MWKNWEKPIQTTSLKMLTEFFPPLISFFVAHWVAQKKAVPKIGTEWLAWDTSTSDPSNLTVG